MSFDILHNKSWICIHEIKVLEDSSIDAIEIRVLISHTPFYVRILSKVFEEFMIDQVIPAIKEELKDQMEKLGIEPDPPVRRIRT